MKKIRLTQNKYVLVDNDDYKLLSKQKWYYNQGYACYVKYYNKGKSSHKILMHRVINKTSDGLETDHIDGNKLNNQKINLRAVTKSQNMCNRGLQKNSTSGYKGVAYRGKVINKWRAYITKNKNRYYLGDHVTKELAALAYNNKATELFGEYARLNEINI